MRAAVFVSIVLFGCDPAASDRPAAFDNDLPARMECTSAGYTEAIARIAWRGTLDVEAGRFDFVGGPHHEDAPFPGEIEYPEIYATATVSWDEEAGTLDVDAEGRAFTLTRAEGVAGFLVSGPVDLGTTEPIGVYCWNPEMTSGFTYDADDGTCRDRDGNEGTEARPVQVIRETGDGQCADLRGVAIDEDDLSYQAWDAFDLRGADMTGASLHFAFITNSALEGARMDTLDYGYAEVSGTVDDHTTIPAEGCEVTYAALQCFR